MLQFPDESKRRHEVQAKLGPLFDIADRAYDFWLTADKDKWHNESKAPAFVRHVAGMIDVQMTRKFRSVVEECARGEARNAGIIARSMFEALLALNFVLKPRVAIIVRPHRNPRRVGAFEALPPSKNLRARKKDYLSRELRADLYFSFIVAQSERGLSRVSAGRKRLTRKADKIRLGTAQTAKDELLKQIPPEWIWLHSHTHQYSGLSTGDLAKALRQSLHRWQQSPYHFQSTDTHATNYSAYVDIDLVKGTVRPRFISTNREVGITMLEGLTILLQSIKDQQRFMFKSNELDQTLHSLSSAFGKARNDFASKGFG
jgi:hypothetical protein